MDKIAINAWTGDGAPESDFGEGALRWILESAGREEEKFLKAETLPDLDNWKDPRVGWGVVVPAKGEFTDAERATGKDLEGDNVLKKLLANRKEQQGEAPVFHYMPEAAPGHEKLYLRNYAAGKNLDLGSELGLEDDQLPFYLLIYGSPDDIPWNQQYALQVRHAVGRLDPSMPGIDNYVDQVVNDWAGARSDPNTTVTWAVDHGSSDITRLMRKTVASKLHEAFKGDSDINDNAFYLDGKANAANATGAALIAKLKAVNPGMIVTSSHGMTGPLNNLSKMVENLGIPVDQKHELLDLNSLLEAWQPDGAIWYAQACCSAGSNSPSDYRGLFDSTSAVGKVLEGVAHGGSHIAPLPSRLLGCKKPARAYFGQIEPTFNYTLQNPDTRQILTHGLPNAFYERLYQPLRVGRILEDYHKVSSVKFRQRQNLLHDFEGEPDDHEIQRKLCYTRTTAIDVESLVMLGDSNRDSSDLR